MKDAARFYKILLALLTIVVALMFLNASGTGDVDNFWLVWMKNLDALGIIDGYETNAAEYPPLCSVILFGAAKLSTMLGVEFFVGFKISLIIWLFLTSLVFWLWTRSFLFTLLVYGAVFLNSVALGYLDIYFTPFLLGALWALKEDKWVHFAVLYAIAFSIKWQALIFGPVVLVYFIQVRSLGDWKQIPWRRLITQVALPAVTIFGALLAIFGAAVTDSFLLGLSHESLSGHALNLPWILTFFLHLLHPETYGGFPDGHIAILDITDWQILLVPSLLFVVSYITLLVSFFRRRRTFDDFVLFAILGVLSYFMFSRGVHENHYYIPLIFGIVLYWSNRSYLYDMLILILMANLNLFIFYGISGEELWFTRVVGIDLSLPLAIINLIFYIVLFLKCLGLFFNETKSASEM